MFLYKIYTETWTVMPTYSQQLNWALSPPQVGIENQYISIFPFWCMLKNRIWTDYPIIQSVIHWVIRIRFYKKRCPEKFHSGIIFLQRTRRKQWRTAQWDIQDYIFQLAMQWNQASTPKTSCVSLFENIYYCFHCFLMNIVLSNLNTFWP